VTTIYPGFIREAGMFVDANISLPAGTGTRSPEDVARAVLRAVRRNLAEITVAAFEQSLGALLGGVRHSWVAWAQRAMGATAISKRLSAAQARKR
jgi:short-subunit dehydrogenase